MRRSKRNKSFPFRGLYLFLCCVAVATALFVSVCNIIVVNDAEGFIISEEEAKSLDADCVLVLGAKVYSDGTLHPILASRVSTGLALYESKAAKKLLLSGDHGTEDYDEVNAMRDYALEKGVSDGDIFLDHAGFSTYESVYRARDIFKAKKMIIVTQGFHLSRAVYLARALGLDAYGVACGEDGNDYPLANDIRETLARVKAVGDAVIKPKPTYLGEAIPISGSAEATKDKV